MKDGEPREYSVEFKATGKVRVLACSEEQARARSLDDIIVPGLWFEDFPVVTIESVEVVGREASGGHEGKGGGGRVDKAAS